MVNRYKDRITILDDQEIEDLYGLPRFAHDERACYFSLTPEESAVAGSHRTLANRVLFIQQGQDPESIRNRGRCSGGGAACVLSGSQDPGDTASRLPAFTV
jgi:hypothetical protein